MKSIKPTAEASIYLDTIRPKKNGKSSVKIKITFNRKRKYYSTGIELTEKELEKVLNAQRNTTEEKTLKKKINAFLTKAESTIDRLKVFTFDLFDEMYLEQRNIKDSVSFAFDKYTDKLTSESRLGTAVSYRCAKNSIEAYKNNLTFAEITPTLLKKYETWMLQNDKSESTVGIYLRSLRAIYNVQNIDPSLYPFGSKSNNKYTIPTSRNIKKALTIEEIVKIYNSDAELNSTKEMAKDYWLFLYLCNGMNVKDFCLLKWSDIDEQTLTYRRAKTKRSAKDSKKITIALKPETWDIIKKWGQPSLSKDAYIFPHLNNGITAERERALYQQLTKTINKYMKLIAAETGINKKITTYYARHSFATVLKRSKVNIGMISELLGHSSVDVTESYLDGFELDHIQQDTAHLTKGFNRKEA
jgi:integrase/recombinase XerD